MADIARAEVKTFDKGLVWELWWKKDALFASTNEQRVRELASLINLGRDDFKRGAGR